MRGRSTIRINKTIHNNEGFTLVELLVSLLLIGVLLGLIFFIYFYGTNTFNKGSKQTFVQQDTRIISEIITKEIRNSKAISNNLSNVLSADDNYYFELLFDANQLVKKKYNKVGDVLETTRFADTLSDLSFEISSNNNDIIIVKIMTLDDNQQFSTSQEILINNTDSIKAFEGLANNIFYTKYD